MDAAQFANAKRITIQIEDLRSELKIWTEDLTMPHRLGYCDRFGRESPNKFKNSISPKLFKKFRDGRLNEIRGEIVKLELEFSKL